MLKAREAWPWHLDFAGSARVAQEAFDIDVLADAIRGAYDMVGRALVLEMLPESWRGTCATSIPASGLWQNYNQSISLRNCPSGRRTFGRSTSQSCSALR